MAMSTTTLPSSMPLSISRVSTFGALAPVTSTAPTTRSAPATSRATTSWYGYSAVTLLPRRIISSMRSVRISNTVTFAPAAARSEEHTSELQSLMRISYAVFCLKQKQLPDTKTHKPEEHHAYTPLYTLQHTTC